MNEEGEEGGTPLAPPKASKHGKGTRRKDEKKKVPALGGRSRFLREDRRGLLLSKASKRAACAVAEEVPSLRQNKQNPFPGQQPRHQEKEREHIELVAVREGVSVGERIAVLALTPSPLLSQARPLWSMLRGDDLGKRHVWVEP